MRGESKGIAGRTSGGRRGGHAGSAIDVLQTIGTARSTGEAVKNLGLAPKNIGHQIPVVSHRPGNSRRIYNRHRQDLGGVIPSDGNGVGRVVLNGAGECIGTRKRARDVGACIGRQSIFLRSENTVGLVGGDAQGNRRCDGIDARISTAGAARCSVPADRGQGAGIILKHKINSIGAAASSIKGVEVERKVLRQINRSGVPTGAALAADILRQGNGRSGSRGVPH